jgi:hypothetical protein
MQAETLEYERILLVKPEIFMFRIPPRTSNRAYRASEWTLDKPDWSGRLRIVSLSNKCIIKLEDKNSGDLFAACPVDSYPSAAVESVSDSARYFVLQIKDPTGRTAFIGAGFTDRSDSFDFNVALQDHFKHLKKDQELKEISKNPPNPENEKKLDLSFKEGQTIKINIGKKSDSSAVPRQKPKTSGMGAVGGMGILLPPPPGSNKAAAAQVAFNTNPVPLNTYQSNLSNNNASSNKSNPAESLLLDFDSTPSQKDNTNTNSSNSNDWGLF